jgi:hypothetical protein
MESRLASLERRVDELQKYADEALTGIQTISLIVATLTHDIAKARGISLNEVLGYIEAVVDEWQARGLPAGQMNWRHLFVEMVDLSSPSFGSPDGPVQAPKLGPHSGA